MLCNWAEWVLLIFGFEARVVIWLVYLGEWLSWFED